MRKTNVNWPGITIDNKTRVVDELLSKNSFLITHQFNKNILFEQKTLYGFGQTLDE